MVGSISHEMRARSASPLFIMSTIVLIALGGSCRKPDDAAGRVGEDASPRWISPPVNAPTADKSACPILRTSFRLQSRPAGGKVRVVGLGHYSLRLNGKPVGDSVIDQAWSQYDKTLYTQEFDIAGLVRKGENVFGVMLGNAFWHIGPTNDPGRFQGYATDFAKGWTHLLWLEARFRMKSGEEVMVVSGPDWKWTAGPLTFSDVYGGEDYDARLEPRGWDRPGFDDDRWKGIAVLPEPAARLVPLIGPPMKEFEVFQPTEIRDLGTAGYTYVFPQNCSALLRYTLSGKPGSRVRFKPAEDIDDKGLVRFYYTWDTGQEVWQDYIMGRGEEETHETLFSYVGCRYVGLTGAVPAGEPNPDGLPVVRKLELVHVRAANPIVGVFSCSSDLQNSIQHISDWAIRSNMGPYATDCPHREKYAWLEQTWHMARSISYLFDVHDWYKRMSHNIRDVQRPDGHILTKAPMYLTEADPHGVYHEAAEWGIAGVLDPWHLYEWYGDLEELAASYDSMKRYIDYLTGTAKDGIITTHLGDWLDYAPGGKGFPTWTPQQVSATTVWALGAKTVALAAQVLKKGDDAARYEALFERIKADFQGHFYDPRTKTVKNNGSCQAGNAAALCVGLIPEMDREGALRAIVDDLERRDWQQTSGEVFHVFFMRALAEGGRGDVLQRVYSREGVGSFGHMVKTGLTTLPETWDARRGTIYGLNHFAFGHLVEWHFAYIAGIRQAPASFGWKRILIAPQPGNLKSASADFNSPAGQISVKWSAAAGRFELKATVPEGVEATAILPDGSGHALVAGPNALSCPFPM
jgi:alpha-L-rhamnosidase